MTPLYSVKECLRGYTADALAQICDRWNLAISNPANRLRAIEKVLTDPLHVEKALSALSPAERRVAHLFTNRPYVPAKDILSVPALAGQTPISGVVQTLATWGFVLALPEEGHGTFSLQQFARHDQTQNGLSLSLLDHVRKSDLESPPLDFALPSPSDEIPETGSAREAAPDTATSAFLETLRIVETLALRVTATGEIHKSDAARAKELASEAGIAPDIYGLALMMGRQLGCMEAKSGRLEVTQQAERWSELDAAHRTRDLFDAYIASEDLIDIALFFPQLTAAFEEHLPAGSLRRTYHKVLIAKLLASLHADAWYTVDAFVDFVRRADPNLLFVEERWRAIATNTHDPSPAWRDRSWQVHEKRLIAWVVQSVIAKLGMVELASEGRFFRLTPTGLFALGAAGAPPCSATDDADALVVQPDFEVIAYFDKCPPGVRRKLDTFCERVRGGVVSTYRLTKDSVYRGLKTGVTLPAFLALLQRHSRRALPSNVVDQVTTWERKASSVTIYAGCQLAECLSADDAARLASREPASRRLGDHFVLLAQQPEDAELRVSYAQAEHRCVVQDEGLTLRAPWEQSSLFVRRRLLEIGDVQSAPNGDLVLTLSKEHLRREVDWGLHAAALEGLVEKPLAPRYRTALRTWSGDENPPTLHSATLVRFDAAETCASVMEMSDLAQHVEGRLGLYTVALRAGALTAFKKSLKTLGLHVDRNGTVLDDGAPEDWAVQWVESRRPPQPTTEDAVKT
ncbi:MAG: helicase-associated domain-containing protein, partial [Candidatus Hydrogenedentes bacterium]|nr:helicase-associated domain-containing protein [Candidatus Hydrogenedentota bacterium]